MYIFSLIELFLLRWDKEHFLYERFQAITLSIVSSGLNEHVSSLYCNFLPWVFFHAGFSRTVDYLFSQQREEYQTPSLPCHRLRNTEPLCPGALLWLYALLWVCVCWFFLQPPLRMIFGPRGGVSSWRLTPVRLSLIALRVTRGPVAIGGLIPPPTSPNFHFKGDAPRPSLIDTVVPSVKVVARVMWGED